MAITPKQIELTQQFRSELREQIKDYTSAPDEVKAPFDQLWTAFKEVAEFDDDNQADLAAFGALAQFAILAQEFDDEKLRDVLSLFSVSILTKIRKGDRLD